MTKQRPSRPGRTPNPSTPVMGVDANPRLPQFQGPVLDGAAGGKMKRSDLPYEAVYAMKPCGRYETYVLAFQALYRAVQDDIRHNRPMTEHVLFTATWIETPDGPLMFHEACERAERVGCLVDGKFVFPSTPIKGVDGTSQTPEPRGQAECVRCVKAGVHGIMGTIQAADGMICPDCNNFPSGV